MVRWKSLLSGALTFTAAHFVEVAVWQKWFDPGGEYRPWFLNSGRAVALTAACLFIVAAVAAAATSSASRRESLIRGSNIAGGAVAAMITVLVAIGPGTIFPIVLAFGAAIAAASSIIGAMAGDAVLSRGRR